MSFFCKKFERNIRELEYRNSALKEELNFIDNCKLKNKSSTCKHKDRIFLGYLPKSQMYMFYCRDCGFFSPVMCGHGGSGFVCEKCARGMARDVVYLG